MAEANRISSMLNTVLGADRFPVKVDELALEYSRQCFSDSPIDKVQGEDLDGFDGLLKANKSRSKWLVLYNSATPSEGRKRFTIAHEFGHYILHRHQQDIFECGDGDIETGDNNERDIEAEADLFASTLLMPLDDFRRQVDGQPISFDLLGHCADRYGVSLTAAALRWTEIAPKRAVLVASRDDPWASLACTAYWADRWGSVLIDIGAAGHINADSGHGPWPRGLALLQALRDSYAGLPLGSIDDAHLTHKGKRGALARLRHRTRFDWDVFSGISS